MAVARGDGGIIDVSDFIEFIDFIDFIVVVECYI